MQRFTIIRQDEVSSMVLFTLLLLALGSSAGARPDGLSSDYNGKWWLGQSQDVQIAYLAGDSDCYSYEVRGHSYSDSLSEQAAAKVTGHLRQHAPEESLPLASSLRRIFVGEKHPHPTKWEMRHAEVWPEKHGYFNGDYWNQLGKGSRGAFVAGYLSCEISFRHWRVRHPADYYVRAINRWYGIDQNDEMHGERADDKIATVIQRLPHD